MENIGCCKRMSSSAVHIIVHAERLLTRGASAGLYQSLLLRSTDGKVTKENFRDTLEHVCDPGM
jgi:hypothetical protein